MMTRKTSSKACGSAVSARAPQRLAVLLIAALLLGILLFPLAEPAGSTVSAAEEYTYTVRLYQGGQGTFDGGEDPLVISGLKYGDRITIGDAETTGGYSLSVVDAQGVTLRSASLSLADGSKFYVKGIRQSGRDNNTVGTKSFEITEDMDFVVAYGIQGDPTSYTARYVGPNGEELLPSVTYTGNVGDKPVVAYLYKEGYRPDYYNLTKTLSRDETENVFTFHYVVKEPIIIHVTEGTGSSSSGSSNGGNSGTNGSNSNGSNPGATTSTEAGASGITSSDANAADSAGLNGTAPGASAAGDADGTQEIGDLDLLTADSASADATLSTTGATVEGNASGNPSADGNSGKGSHSTAKIVIPVIAGGGILAFIVAMLRRTAR